MKIKSWSLWTPVVGLVALAGMQGSAAQSAFEIAGDVAAVRIESSGQNFTPRQSVTPGGVSRHTSDYEHAVTWEPGAWRAREDWELHNLYPADQIYTFSMTYHEPFGRTEGSDGRVAPAETRPMGAARIGANFKELWLTNPLILAAHAEVVPRPAVMVEGKRYDQALLVAHDTHWNLLLDQSDGLPVELSTIEVDQWGETEHRVVYSDWREVSGVPFPYRVEQYLGDKLLSREIRNSITVNPTIASGSLELSGLDATDESLRDWGWSMSHFFQGRAGLAGPQDYFETHSISFHEVGDAVYQIIGSEGDNNLLVVGPDGLAIVDAPWFDRRSEEVLAELAERWPDKPLKYVILTHHHIDHSGGFMAYVRAGATLVTSQGNAELFDNALRAAGHESVSIVAVGQSAALDDIGRRVEAYDIVNSHADATLIAYVPDERLAFTTDLYSPGRPRQMPLSVSELQTSLRFHGVEVERYVGGHGEGYGYPDDD